jgi:hypothetical protein
MKTSQLLLLAAAVAALALAVPALSGEFLNLTLP